MYNTLVSELFDTSDEFAYPDELRPAMEAGFTASEASANNPLVLGDHWRCSWPVSAALAPRSVGQASNGSPVSASSAAFIASRSLPGGSAPKAPPSYNMGGSISHCEAIDSTLRLPGGEFSARTALAGMFIDVSLRHGCPAPPPAPVLSSRVQLVAPLRASSSAECAAPASGPVSGLVVDWLNFTYKTESDELTASLKSMLGDDWENTERGLYGYRSSSRCGHITILWNGGSEGMGTHVQLSGQGCRELEGRCLASLGACLDWRGWFSDRVKEGAKFVHTDLAFDDLEGRISIEKITDAYKSGQTVTRFNTFSPVAVFGPNQALKMNGFNFGQRSADTSIVCYDKKLEQQGKASTLELEGYAEKLAALEQGWTRVELRNRNARSHALVLRVIAEGFGVVASVLRGYLDVRVPVLSDGKRQTDRWEPVAWWADFCGWAESARLKVEGSTRSFQSTLVWLDRQVGTVLAMVKAVLPEPMAFIEQLMERGGRRFGARHLNMMSAYLLAGQVKIPADFFGHSLPDLPSVWSVSRA